MFDFDLNKILTSLYSSIIEGVEFYLPKIVWALVIIWIWIIISIAAYRFVMYLFKKFKIIELIDKLTIRYDNKKVKKTNLIKTKKNPDIKVNKISDKIKIDEITSKAISYYIFLVFFRLSIVVIWIKEVEEFLWDLLTYLPSLFIAVVIWFFWIRFANFIHNVIYHALDLSKQKTANIVATWAKIIILFFTLMVVLDRIWIATEITNTILIWFISMLSIAWWLAFWLWWKDIAKEILESFKNK